MQTRTATRGTGGAYSVDAAVLTPGTYTARAEQSDTAGNTGYSTAATFAITGGADVSAPVVALSAPPASATDTTPTFSGTAGTLAGDASTITVRVHSGSAVTGALMQTLSAARGAGGAYSVDAAALAPGTYTARAEQSDSAGNTGYSPARTFAITGSQRQRYGGAGGFVVVAASTAVRCLFRRSRLPG